MEKGLFFFLAWKNSRSFYYWYIFYRGLLVVFLKKKRTNNMHPVYTPNVQLTKKKSQKGQLFLPVPSIPGPLGDVRQPILQPGADVGKTVANGSADAARGAVDRFADASRGSACGCHG